MRDSGRCHKHKHDTEEGPERDATDREEERPGRVAIDTEEESRWIH